MSALEIVLLLAVAGLGIALFLQLRQFSRLRRWASQSRLSDPPEARGAWGEVFNSLHRHRRSTLKRRRELAQLMVRSRRGAQALPYGVAVLTPTIASTVATMQCGERSASTATRPRRPSSTWCARPTSSSTARRGLLRAASARFSGGRRTLSLQIVSFGHEEHLLLSQDVTGATQVEAMRRDFVANARTSCARRLPCCWIPRPSRPEARRRTRARYVGLMAPQAERMSACSTIADPLRARARARPPDTERVVLRSLLQRVRAEAGPVGGQAPDLAGNVRLTRLLGAESEIASAFVNLVSTRCAIRRPVRDRLRWKSTGGGGEFSVEDSGIVSTRTPAAAYRALLPRRPRPSRETGGTGLGLSIVKHAPRVTRPRLR